MRWPTPVVCLWRSAARIPDHRVDPGGGVAESGWYPHGRPVRGPVLAHGPAHGLGDPLVALELCVRTGAAKALDGGDHDARVDLPQALIAETQAFDGTGPQVLHDDVGVHRQALEQRAAALALQIQGHPFLVGVQEEEEPGVLVGVLGEPAARRLAAGRLDLDHLGAQPRQRLGAARTGLPQGQVQDADPIERSSHDPDLPSREPLSRLHPPQTLAPQTSYPTCRLPLLTRLLSP